MRRLMDFRRFCLGVSLATLAGLVLSPLAFAADGNQSKKRMVEYKGRLYVAKDVSTTLKRLDPEKLAPLSQENTARSTSVTKQQTKVSPLRGKVIATPATKALNRADGIPTLSPEKGLRDAEDWVFFENLNDPSGAPGSFGDLLELETPGAGVPAILSISDTTLYNMSGNTTDYTGQTLALLVEFYDEYIPSAGGTSDPVHSTYLGGEIFTSAGPLPPGSYWTFYAVELDIPIALGADNKVFVSIVPGTIENDGTFDRFVEATADGTLSTLVAADEGSGPTVGEEKDGFYIDGSEHSGVDPAGDRIYTGYSGQWYFGSAAYNYALIKIQGGVFDDCANDGYPDAWEILCGEMFTDPAPHDCSTNAMCNFGWTILDPTTNGLFGDPFDIGYVFESECDLAPSNGIPDECDQNDCNTNGVPDACDMDCAALNPFNPTQTCLDAYPTTCGGFAGGDCDSNGTLDICQIDKNSTAPGGPFYCDPDLSTCASDCDNNGILDICDYMNCEGPGYPCWDCDEDGVLDGCELASGESLDCDNNGILDHCERVMYFDCNHNGQEDYCDIFHGLSNDLNTNGIPDECAAPEECAALWGDFEDHAQFPPETYVAGIDIDTSGSNWEGQGWITNATGDACSGDAAIQFKGSNTTETVFSDDFKLDEYGNTPDPVAEMSISFQARVDGAPDSTFDFLSGLIDRDNDFGLLLVYSSDISSNSLDVSPAFEPGHINVLDPVNGYVSTGVDIVIGQCYDMEVTLFASTQTMELRIDGAKVWSGYTWDEGVERLAYFSMQVWDNGNSDINTTGVPYSYLTYDNFTICEGGSRSMSCSEFLMPDGSPSQDCDSNGICDHFEAEKDLDGNGVLDHCEGYCYDCNNNHIPDAAEIAAGSAPDTNVNGIIDDCEFDFSVSNVYEDFSSFAVDTVIGIGNPAANSWTELIGGPAIIGNGSGFGTGNYLKVKWAPQDAEDEDTEQADRLTWVITPRMVNVEPADIELWSWDMQITNTDFGQLFVEVLDLCEDYGYDITQANNGNYYLGDVLRTANTGLSWVTNNVEGFEALPEGEIRMQMLKDDSAVGESRAYENLSITPAVVAGQVVGNSQAVGLRIINSRGDTEAYWNDTQTNLFDEEHMLAGPATTETQRLVRIQDTDVPQGGDSQILIRAYDFGATNDTEFWFDNFHYETAVDCDNDGRDDVAFITEYPMFDKNSDLIPDWCQDCNGDCTFDAGGTSWTAACLNDAEIAAGAPDCNGNGIPDYCDIDQTLPNEGMFNGTCMDTQSFPNCYITKLGGGSYDLNTNSIPDDCDVTSGLEFDCNGNRLIDSVEVAAGTALDVNADGIPDECQDDCNHNGVPDVTDLANGLTGGGSQDRSGDPGAPDYDDIPDECCLHAVDGDMDADGDVDAADFKAMQWCAGQKGHDDAQPQGRVTGSAFDGTAWNGIPCGCADLNADGYVNEIDMSLFHYYITGPTAATP